MAYGIQSEVGEVVASDCFFKYRYIEEKIPLGIMESLEECTHSHGRIRAEADFLLPLYDPLVPERLKKVLTPH